MDEHEGRVYRIAIDAMGGDFAPLNEIQGAILAYRNKPSDMNFEIIFVGKESKIKDVLSSNNDHLLKYQIINASDIITMEDEPTAAIKKKRDSSLYKGLELHAQGYADAFVSAGNTGATLSTATVLLGRIEGVSRPTIGSFFPTSRNVPTLVLDVGANIESKARFLYEYAVMGSIYTTQMLGLEHPKVGLLNIGEESTKGTEVLLETYNILKNSQLNFIGNVEGRDILQGTADVIVCDGFIGNIVLKFAESIFVLLKSKFREFAKRNMINSLLMGMLKPALKKIFSEFDYQKYGGVPILGVNGVVIVGHGKSSPEAIQNMIFKAIEQIKREVNNKIKVLLNPTELSNKN